MGRKKMVQNKTEKIKMENKINKSNKENKKRIRWNSKGKSNNQNKKIKIRSQNRIYYHSKINRKINKKCSHKCINLHRFNLRQQPNNKQLTKKMLLKYKSKKRISKYKNKDRHKNRRILLMLIRNLKTFQQKWHMLNKYMARNLNMLINNKKNNKSNSTLPFKNT